MSKWFQANQLVLHVEKSKYCKIHSVSICLLSTKIDIYRSNS